LSVRVRRREGRRLPRGNQREVAEVVQRRGLSTRQTPSYTQLLERVLGHAAARRVPALGDTPTAAHMLWSLIDVLHQHTTTAISSNIKLSEWGKYLGDATVTAAILDRLAMTSVRLDIDGPSYRQHLARQRAESTTTTDPS
jgi:hypothetical protein